MEFLGEEKQDYSLSHFTPIPFRLPYRSLGQHNDLPLAAMVERVVHHHDVPEVVDGPCLLLGHHVQFDVHHQVGIRFVVHGRVVGLTVVPDSIFEGEDAPAIIFGQVVFVLRDRLPRVVHVQVQAFDDQSERWQVR